MQHGFCSKRYHQCQRRLVLLRLTQLIALLGVTWQILIPLCALHWSFDDAQYVVGCAQVYHWVGIFARSSGCRSHSKHASASHSLVAFPCSASGESSPVDATRCLTRASGFLERGGWKPSMMAWSMPSGFFAARSRDLSRLAAVFEMAEDLHFWTRSLFRPVRSQKEATCIHAAALGMSFSGSPDPSPSWVKTSTLLPWMVIFH